MIVCGILFETENKIIIIFFLNLMFTAQKKNNNFTRRRKNWMMFNVFIFLEKNSETIKFAINN